MRYNNSSTIIDEHDLVSFDDHFLLNFKSFKFCKFFKARKTNLVSSLTFTSHYYLS